MSNKIDVEDLTGGPEEGSAPVSQQAHFEERIREFCKIGLDAPITSHEAPGLPTSLLIMSVTQFPSLAQEVGTALQMAAASGNSEVASALHKSMEVMNTSYLSCSEELEIRIPPRKTLAEVGLEDTEEGIVDKDDGYDGVE